MNLLNLINNRSGEFVFIEKQLPLNQSENIGKMASKKINEPIQGICNFFNTNNIIEAQKKLLKIKLGLSCSTGQAGKIYKVLDNAGITKKTVRRHRLAEGAYGKVYKIEQLSSDYKYSVFADKVSKIYFHDEKKTKKSWMSVLNEYKILKKLTKLAIEQDRKDVLDGLQEMFLSFQLVRKRKENEEGEVKFLPQARARGRIYEGDLCDLNEKLTMKQKIEGLDTLLKTFEFLYTNGIAYPDLKSENIFKDEKNGKTLFRFGDLDGICWKDEAFDANKVVLTSGVTLFKDVEFVCANDGAKKNEELLPISAFQMGIFLFEIFSAKKHPYQSSDLLECLDQDAPINRDILDLYSEELQSTELKDLITDMIAVDRDKRPTGKEIWKRWNAIIDSFGGRENGGLEKFAKACQKVYEALLVRAAEDCLQVIDLPNISDRGDKKIEALINKIEQKEKDKGRKWLPVFIKIKEKEKDKDKDFDCNVERIVSRTEKGNLIVFEFDDSIVEKLRKGESIKNIIEELFEAEDEKVQSLQDQAFADLEASRLKDYYRDPKKLKEIKNRYKKCVDIIDAYEISRAKKNLKWHPTFMAFNEYDEYDKDKKCNVETIVGTIEPGYFVNFELNHPYIIEKLREGKGIFDTIRDYFKEEEEKKRRRGEK